MKTTSAKEAGSRAPARRAAPSKAPRPQKPELGDNGRKKGPSGSPRGEDSKAGPRARNGSARPPEGNGNGAGPQAGVPLVAPDGTPVDLKRYPVLGARLYDVEELSLDPKNARVHDQESIDVIKALLKKYGQRKNIVVDASGLVRAGNGTLEAARQLGWKWLVGGPAPKKAEDARGYALGDNRSAEKSRWDPDQLGSEIRALAGLDYDVSSLGWDEHELAFFKDPAGENVSPPAFTPEGGSVPRLDQLQPIICPNCKAEIPRDGW